MKFFITGGAGFIGSNLVDRLLSQGHLVVAYDNFDAFYSVEIKRKNLKEAFENKNFSLIEDDLRNKEGLKQALKNFMPDVVIHLAAKAGVRPSIDNPEIYYEVNVTGTLNLLEAMREAGLKKLIFSSSSSVYGNNTKVPFSESDAVDHPISPYAASKKAGELLCHTYHHLYGFDIFCVRLFTVYGKRQRPDLAINKFFKAIAANERITMYGDGSTKRDYTYVDDILDGILKSVEHLKGYQILNLGESQSVSLAGLIASIEQITGKKANIEQAEMQAGDVNLTYADISKAQKLIGYAPSTKIEDGLRKYFEWLKSNS